MPVEADAVASWAVRVTRLVQAAEIGGLYNGPSAHLVTVAHPIALFQVVSLRGARGGDTADHR